MAPSMSWAIAAVSVPDQIEKYGAGVYRKGGLKVYTTIDPKLQKAGRETIDRTLYLKTDPSSAIALRFWLSRSHLACQFPFQTRRSEELTPAIPGPARFSRSV